MEIRYRFRHSLSLLWLDGDEVGSSHPKNLLVGYWGSQRVLVSLIHSIWTSTSRSKLRRFLRMLSWACAVPFLILIPSY